MRSLQEADLVVPMTHLDMADDIQLAHDFEKDWLFPVIIGGHDHDVFDQVHSNTRIIKVGSDAYNAAIIEYKWRQDDSFEKERKQPPEVSVQWIEAKNYEPHEGVQQLVDDRKRLLNELETARLFSISSALEKIPNNDGTFSTKRNRYQTTSASSVFCSIIRTGLNADCCIINAGGIRGDTEYDVHGWFTFADLKTEFPFQDPVAVFSIPGNVLEDAIRFSRLASKLDPPEENSGLLHSCDMIEYKDRTQDNDCDSLENFLPQDSEDFLPGNSTDEDDDDEKLIEYIGCQLFDRAKDYNVALPVTMLNGLDNNTPLLEWVKASGLKISEDAGKPVKVIFVETFAISFWIELGSFAELDIDGDGIITRDEIQQAIAKKFDLDCESENDARYLKMLVDDTMSVADTDNSGNIDLHEFLAAKLTAKVKFQSKQTTNKRSIANPSMILHRMASDELGFDARQSTLHRTIDSVKNIVRERDQDNSDERDWHSNLSNPNLKLSSENQLI
ncbi:hypothetical protein CTEN210_16006 [Chaetoceros tenuissimus]|uniref:EF-hand domain-containing protein n=1 Tax=Chaetoceros tenuissimus TaxID=426638 RepID=A0AAD3DAS5_9STRA|nr:hypothetical protein CTEN210_16006 [Chaetoceros tenuissimus]